MMLDHALEYARRGWLVIPLHSIENGACTCRRHCTSPGKHPRTLNGLKSGTTNENVIREWWDLWPRANIGIVTGSGSGILVLDVDAKRSVDIGGALIPEGEAALEDAERLYGALPETLSAVTGSGGRHVVFRYPPDGEYRNRAGLLPSIDVRADGGYIVAPPSMHASGHAYAWANNAQPAPAPGWLLDLIRGPGISRATTSSTEVIPQGQRNTELYRVACRLRGEGLEEPDILLRLEGENAARCQPPLDHEELRVIAHSASRHEINEPPPIWDLPESPVHAIPEGADLATSLSDLLRNPPAAPEAVVEGLIFAGTGCIIAGPPGIGKTWISLDLALSVASGQPFLDRFKTTQGPVLIIDEEGHAYGNYSRFSMLVNGKDLRVPISDIDLRLAIGKGIRLDTDTGISTVRRLVERYRPSLVIADALVRFHGSDENSSSDMARFFAISKTLMANYGCAVCFVHHTRKPAITDVGDVADLMRGSGEIRAWPDTIMVVRRGSDATELRVDHAKSRWSRELSPFAVRMLIYEDQNHATLSYTGDIEPESRGAGNTMSAIERVLQSDLSGSGTTRQIAAAMRLSEQTVKRHLDVLVAAGSVKKDPFAPHVYSLSVAPGPKPGVSSNQLAAASNGPSGKEVIRSTPS